MSWRGMLLLLLLPWSHAHGASSGPRIWFACCDRGAARVCGRVWCVRQVFHARHIPTARPVGTLIGRDIGSGARNLKDFQEFQFRLPQVRSRACVSNDCQLRLRFAALSGPEVLHKIMSPSMCEFACVYMRVFVYMVCVYWCVCWCELFMAS